MSKYTDWRDAAEAWFVHGYHAVLTVLEPEAEKLGKAEMGAILKAGLEAKAAGGDASAIKNAAIGAAGDTAKTVGMQIGLDTLQTLGTLALAHLTTGPDQAPPPPAE